MNKLINDIYNDYMDILKPYIGNDTTFTNDLKKKGKKVLGRGFRGVFASDKLPKINNKQMYIANLDKLNERGSHWIGVYKHNDKLYVYDSFGRSSKKIIPSIFHRKGGGIVDTQYDPEQSVKEDNCGLRSIAALYMFSTINPNIVAEYL
jgi:hypothetical protein